MIAEQQGREGRVGELKIVLTALVGFWCVRVWEVILRSYSLLRHAGFGDDLNEWRKRFQLPSAVSVWRCFLIYFGTEILFVSTKPRAQIVLDSYP